MILLNLNYFQWKKSSLLRLLHPPILTLYHNILEQILLDVCLRKQLVDVHLL